MPTTGDGDVCGAVLVAGAVGIGWSDGVVSSKRSHAMNHAMCAAKPTAMPAGDGSNHGDPANKNETALTK